VRLPDEVVGQLRTGDLLFASEGGGQARVVDDLRRPGWSMLGVVVRPTDLGVASGVREVLVYAKDRGELSPLAASVEPLPDTTGAVVVCELERAAARKAAERLASRFGTAHAPGAGHLHEQVRAAVADWVAAGNLPGLEQYRDPSPLAPRTCNYPGCGNLEPCDIHG
jgi:hypothetical protein